MEDNVSVNAFRKVTRCLNKSENVVIPMEGQQIIALLCFLVRKSKNLTFSYKLCTVFVVLARQ